jgi:hypothetical protein
MEHRRGGRSADEPLVVAVTGDDQPLAVNDCRGPGGRHLGVPQQVAERLGRQHGCEHVPYNAATRDRDADGHPGTREDRARRVDADDDGAAGPEHLLDAGRIRCPDAPRRSVAPDVQGLPAVAVQHDRGEPRRSGRDDAAQLLPERLQVARVQVGRHREGPEHADVGLQRPVDQRGRAGGDLDP